MEPLIRNLQSRLQTVPRNRLFLYLFLCVTVIGGSVIGLSFIQKETYQTLFSGLSTEDASMIVAKLKEQKIPYQLGLGGTAVYVPKEKVADIRLTLASQNGLPGSGGVGFELFDKTSYGMTEFMQNINYKRAVQGELSRTINQMPEVKSSRVHIAIPEKTLYTEREKDVTASVFLTLKAGRTLGKDQVMGIVQLVAGSIEGLKTERVVVVDSSGKILYKSGDSNSSVVLSGQQFELQKGVERKVEESIQSMLNTFLPASKSMVRASVELNLRKVEKVEEEYLPSKTAISSEKKSKERSANSNARSGGVPGVASNSPNAAGKDPKQQEAAKLNENEREEAQISYEVSKSVRKIVEPFGDIKKISVAVVVDGRYDKVKGAKGEELKYVPRTQKELSDIKNLVSRAVGYDEERGDKIEVLNVPFEADILPDEKGISGNADKKDLFMNIARYGLYAIMVVSFFVFLVRPILGMVKGGEPSLPLKEIRDVYVKKNEGGETKAIEEKRPGSDLASAMKDRALVGSIIKEWVREGA
jgi:flagellar M-ring protein FliF